MSDYINDLNNVTVFSYWLFDHKYYGKKTITINEIINNIGKIKSLNIPPETLNSSSKLYNYIKILFDGMESCGAVIKSDYLNYSLSPSCVTNLMFKH